MVPLITQRESPEPGGAPERRAWRAPESAPKAAAIILDGVRSGAWRILVGQDATMIDERIRATPEAAYDYAELFRGMTP